MTDDELSRTLNAFCGGDPAERFCSRVYRLRWRGAWPLVWYIDYRCRVMRGERGHCRRVWQEDRLARLEMDARFRHVEGAA